MNKEEVEVWFVGFKGFNVLNYKVNNLSGELFRGSINDINNLTNEMVKAASVGCMNTNDVTLNSKGLELLKSKIQ